MSTEYRKQAWYFSISSVVALLLLTLVLYQHTLLYLVGLWNQVNTGDYAHGYLVLLISGYLVFRNRQRLFALMPCLEYRALLMVVAASVLLLVSALVDVEVMQAVGLLLLVLAIVWAVLGNQVIRELVFPVLFIGFAIPIWFPLLPVLQNLTADVVFWVIRLLSVPALRHDNMIVLPAGTMSIAEACSGLRYVLAALTLGTLYAYTNYSSLKARLLVVLVSVSSAVLANILRVFIVVYLGYTTDMQHSLVHEHVFLGWYLFGGLVVILLFLDARLHREQSPVMQQEVKMPVVSKIIFPNYFIFIAGVCVLVSVGPAIIYQVKYSLSEQDINAVPGLPFEAGDWSRSVAYNDDWMPVYNGAVNQKQAYRKDNDEVVLYMGYYLTQNQGNELISDLNNISGNDVWSTVYPGARLQGRDDQQVLEQLLKNSARQQRLVWYWYDVAGQVTTNRYEAKILQVLGLITGKRRAFIVAAAVRTEGDIDSSREILKDFILSIEEPMKKEIGRIVEH